MAFSEKAPSTVALQDRDMAVLRELFESRVMTISHVAILHFNGSEDAATKRLQKLKAAGFVSERPRRSFEPSVLQIARAGIKILADRGVFQEYPLFDLPALERRAHVSALTVAHELEVLDVKAALARAVRSQPAFSVAEFVTWPLLLTFSILPPGPNKGEVTVRPDGFIRLQERESDGGVSEHTFYLELDRSTETLDTLVSRAVCYLAYYRSGGFAEKCGGLRTAFQDYPFRVLIVCKTAERRNNIAERLLQSNPPIFRHAWLSTIEEAVADPFGTIWICPVDYRDAVTGTPYEQDIGRPKSSYVRRSAREALVESRIKKRSILAAVEA